MRTPMTLPPVARQALRSSTVSMPERGGSRRAGRSAVPEGPDHVQHGTQMLGDRTCEVRTLSARTSAGRMFGSGAGRTIGVGSSSVNNPESGSDDFCQKSMRCTPRFASDRDQKAHRQTSPCIGGHESAGTDCADLRCSLAFERR